MGTCFFRCIYFTIESGLVQTHVHQITNMVLATASFPRNAYFCQTALFSKQLFHIFSCLPIGSISQISILQFLHSYSLRVLLRIPVVAHCWWRRTWKPLSQRALSTCQMDFNQHWLLLTFAISFNINGWNTRAPYFVTRVLSSTLYQYFRMHLILSWSMANSMTRWHHIEDMIA